MWERGGLGGPITDRMAIGLGAATRAIHCRDTDCACLKDTVNIGSRANRSPVMRKATDRTEVGRTGQKWGQATLGAQTTD